MEAALEVGCTVAIAGGKYKGTVGRLERVNPKTVNVFITSDCAFKHTVTGNIPHKSVRMVDDQVRQRPPTPPAPTNIAADVADANPAEVAGALGEPRAPPAATFSTTQCVSCESLLSATCAAGCRLHAQCAACYFRYAKGCSQQGIGMCHFNGECTASMHSVYQTVTCLEGLYERVSDNDVLEHANRLLDALMMHRTGGEVQQDKPDVVVDSPAEVDLCQICFESKPKALHCIDGHIACDECGQGYIDACAGNDHSDFIKSGGRIRCFYPGCDDCYSNATVFKIASPEAIESLTRVQRQIGEAQRQIEIDDLLARIASLEVSGKPSSDAPLETQEELVARVCRTIRNEHLILRCPTCKTPSDVDNFIKEATGPGGNRICLAIRCRHGRCGQTDHGDGRRPHMDYCFLCGQCPSGGADGDPKDGHLHVSRCKHNPCKGQPFWLGDEESLREAAGQRVARQVIQWLRIQTDVVENIDALLAIECELASDGSMKSGWVQSMLDVDE